MDEKKKVRFEAPEKPELTDLKEIKPNIEDFNEPERAEAIIRNLNLSVGDTIKEEEPSYNSNTYYVINPRMVLEGNAPEKYFKEVELVKKILLPKEIKLISSYMKRKKEDEKIRDKIYYGITKRVEKIYKWDDKNKIHKPQNKKDIEICSFLDELSKDDIFCGFDNMIYHLLDKENKDFLMCYRCAWNNKPIPNIQEWREVNDGEYLVMTDSEAERYAMDYLTDDDGLWKQAVESGHTTQGMEEWAECVLNRDGRSSIINSYDGCEETETINGTDYYIYRTN